MKLVSGWFKLISLCCLLVGNPLLMPVVVAELEKPKPTVQKLDKQPKLFCDRDLSLEIAQVINRPQLKRSRWGIEIQTLAGENVYSLDGDKFFNPASSAKLLVSAAGLLEFGADHRLKTPVFAHGNPPVLSSLRLYGQGDPTISSQSLKTIVHQLQSRGVKRIENLMIDDSYLAPPAINPTWEWADVHSYFATAVNSTILNQNTVTLTLLPRAVGEPVRFFWDDAIASSQWQVINQAVTGDADIEYAVEIDGDLGKPLLKLRGELAVNEPPDVWDLAVVDPPQYFLESLRLQLSKGGISVTKGTVIDRETELPDLPDTELMAIYAPPLQEILEEINQESNNLYAEVLGKILARRLEFKTSTVAIAHHLEQIGIAPSEYVLVDASGLSRQNLITPQTLVKLLQLMARSTDPKVDRAYRQSLAVAGTSGTLKRRFTNTAIQGNIWGKTGTLTGVGALSGYLNTQSGLPLVFSIIVNNSELENKEIRSSIDELIAIVNRIKQC